MLFVQIVSRDDTKLSYSLTKQYFKALSNIASCDSTHNGTGIGCIARSSSVILIFLNSGWNHSTGKSNCYFHLMLISLVKMRNNSYETDKFPILEIALNAVLPTTGRKLLYATRWKSVHVYTWRRLIVTWVWTVAERWALSWNWLERRRPTRHEPTPHFVTLTPDSVLLPVLQPSTVNWKRCL